MKNNPKINSLPLKMLRDLPLEDLDRMLGSECKPIDSPPLFIRKKKNIPGCVFEPTTPPQHFDSDRV
jgi:hypothetical protein